MSEKFLLRTSVHFFPDIALRAQDKYNNYSPVSSFTFKPLQNDDFFDYSSHAFVFREAELDEGACSGCRKAGMISERMANYLTHCSEKQVQPSRIVDDEHQTNIGKYAVNFPCLSIPKERAQHPLSRESLHANLPIILHSSSMGVHSEPVFAGLAAPGLLNPSPCPMKVRRQRYMTTLPLPHRQAMHVERSSAKSGAEILS